MVGARLCGRYQFSEAGVPAEMSLRPFAVCTYGGPRAGDPAFAQFADREMAGTLFRCRIT